MTQSIARRCVFGLIVLVQALLMASLAHAVPLTVGLAKGVDPNGEPSYTASVTNQSITDSATNLVVTYTLPHAELPISPSPSGGCLFTTGAFHVTVVCNLASLAAQQTHNFVIAVHPTDTSPQDVSVAVTEAGGGSANASTTSTITEVGLTEMQVTMDSTNPGKVGEAMVFHVTVINIQDDDAQNVYALLTLPKKMTWVSGTAGCTKGTNVICKIGRLSPGTGKTVTITVIPTISGWNQATAGLRLTTPDRDFTNNSAATAFWVNP